MSRACAQPDWRAAERARFAGFQKLLLKDYDGMLQIAQDQWRRARTDVSVAVTERGDLDPIDGKTR